MVHKYSVFIEFVVHSTSRRAAAQLAARWRRRFSGSLWYGLNLLYDNLQFRARLVGRRESENTTLGSYLKGRSLYHYITIALKPVHRTMKKKLYGSSRGLWTKNCFACFGNNDLDNSIALIIMSKRRMYFQHSSEEFLRKPFLISSICESNKKACMHAKMHIFLACDHNQRNQ